MFPGACFTSISTRPELLRQESILFSSLHQRVSASRIIELRVTALVPSSHVVPSARSRVSVVLQLQRSTLIRIDNSADRAERNTRIHGSGGPSSRGRALARCANERGDSPIDKRERERERERERPILCT